MRKGGTKKDRHRKIEWKKERSKNKNESSKGIRLNSHKIERTAQARKEDIAKRKEQTE